MVKMVSPSILFMKTSLNFICIAILDRSGTLAFSCLSALAETANIIAACPFYALIR